MSGSENFRILQLQCGVAKAVKTLKCFMAGFSLQEGDFICFLFGAGAQPQRNLAQTFQLSAEHPFRF